MADNAGIPFTSPDEGVQYPDIARELVYHYVKNDLKTRGWHDTFGHDEVFVVWFAKTLQNWKALVSTTLPDGCYYEVTYDGDKKEAYFDVYYKNKNVVIPQNHIDHVVLQMNDGVHDGDTLMKVAESVRHSGVELTIEDVTTIVSSIQNAGILFRERY